MIASLGETGEMKSPGYPLGYPDGVSCNFHFPLIEVGKFIHIYFEDFQLEQIQHYGKRNKQSMMKNSSNISL